MYEAKLRLLIVDDELAIRSSISQIFTEVGYRVRSVPDGRAALAEIRREAPEVLLSELNMPCIAGSKLLPLVRREFPRIKLVAMSGAFSGKKIPLGVPADAFYPKSANVAHLLQIVESVAVEKTVASNLRDIWAPIWVARSVRSASGEAYVMIECPECLRTFPRALKGASEPTCATACGFCGTSIWYAVIPPPDLEA